MKEGEPDVFRDYPLAYFSMALSWVVVAIGATTDWLPSPEWGWAVVALWGAYFLLGPIKYSLDRAKRKARALEAPREETGRSS